MRLLISVGCNNYYHINCLTSAEKDALRVYSTLTSNDDDYCPIHSKLLASPNINELRTALESILLSDLPITDLTFYFAGHACIHENSLYLAFVETNMKSLSITGISLNYILNAMMQTNAMQINIVIDACQAGGLGGALYKAIMSEQVGNSGSTGLSFLAAAAADESAYEDNEGGIFTTSLIRILNGTESIQSREPFLALSEIASSIRIDQRENRQSVSSWQLNIQGANRFSRNPHYDPSSQNSLIINSKIVRNAISLPVTDVTWLKHFTSRFLAAPDDRELLVELQSILDKLKPEQGLPLLKGLAANLQNETNGESEDVFGRSRCQMAIIAASLHLTTANDLDEFHEQLSDFLKIACGDLNEALIEFGSRTLLVDEGIGSSFYFLPLRLSDILGQLGLLLLVDPTQDNLTLVADITEKLVKHYAGSFVCLSEEQAAPLLVFISAVVSHGQQELAESIIGCYFSDLIDCAGRVGDHFLEGKDALQSTLDRYDVLNEAALKLYSNPSDFISVVLTLATLCELDAAVDPSMIFLDHANLNIFLIESLSQSGRIGPVAGENFGITVGAGVWTCADLRRIWIYDILPKIETSKSQSRSVKTASAIAMLVRRERVPWHLLDWI